MATIDDFLRGFASCVAGGQMYPVTHPQFIKVMETAYGHLRSILDEKGELTIGFVDNEIIYENQVLFKISGMLKNLIDHARKKTIEKFYFEPAVTQDDFTRLISFLLTPEAVEEHPDEQLELAGIRHIRVSRLTTPDDDEKKKEADGLSPFERILKDLAGLYPQFHDPAGDIASVHQHLRLTLLGIRDELACRCPEAMGMAVTHDYPHALIESLDTAMLAVTAASKFGFTPDEVIETGMAALLCRIASLSGGGGNSSDQAEGRAADSLILLRHASIVGRLAVVAAWEHDQENLGTAHPVAVIIRLSRIYGDLMRTQGEADWDDPANGLALRQQAPGVAPALVERFVKMVK